MHTDLTLLIVLSFDFNSRIWYSLPPFFISHLFMNIWKPTNKKKNCREIKENTWPSIILGKARHAYRKDFLLSKNIGVKNITSFYSSGTMPVGGKLVKYRSKSYIIKNLLSFEFCWEPEKCWLCVKYNTFLSLIRIHVCLHTCCECSVAAKVHSLSPCFGGYWGGEIIWGGENNIPSEMLLTLFIFKVGKEILEILY